MNSLISTKPYFGLQKLYPFHAKHPKEERIKDMHHVTKVTSLIVQLIKAVMQHF